MCPYLTTNGGRDIRKQIETERARGNKLESALKLLRHFGDDEIVNYDHQFQTLAEVQAHVDALLSNASLVPSPY